MEYQGIPRDTGLALLSDEAIEIVRSTGQLPGQPDPRFVAMVRSQYRRAERYLDDREFDDVLQDALMIYTEACRSYQPTKRYSRGAVGFVGGRVVNRLRNTFRTQIRRRSNWIGELPLDENGNQIVDRADETSAPVDVVAMLSEIVDEAQAALGVSAEKIESILLSAAGGDSSAVEVLRTMATTRKKKEPTLRYVRPYSGERKSQGTITADHVKSGLLRLGIAGDFFREVGIAPEQDLGAAVAWLDQWCESEIERTGKAAECVIEVKGERGCGSILPDDVSVCPYCAENFEEETEPKPKKPKKQKKKSRDSHDNRDSRVDEQAKDPEQRTRTTKDRAGKSKRVARERKKKNERPGRPKIGIPPIETLIAFVETRTDANFRDRRTFVSVWIGESKICTMRKTTAISGYPIAWDVYTALPDKVREAASYFEARMRKAKHYGRDSVIYKGDDVEIVEALLDAAHECVGISDLDEALRVDRGQE